MKKITLFLMLFNSIAVFAQCIVNAGVNDTTVCKQSVQLNALADNEWMALTSPVSTELKSVFFTSDNIGYAVGNGGVILKTTDGGINWVTQISGTSVNLASIYFVDANIGYIVGGGWDHIILKTQDGGASWTIIRQSVGGAGLLNSVYFTDINTGFAVGGTGGGSGLVLKTIDGGINWSTQNPDKNVSSITFTDSNTGYAVGGYTGSRRIYKTIDEGINWTVLLSETSGGQFSSVYFTNTDTGFVVGQNGSILKSADGGANWTTQISGVTSHLNSVYFTGANTGHIVGNNGIILKTTNGGINWTAQTSGITSFINSVFFTNLGNGYCAGFGGAILKYNNFPFNYNWTPATGLSDATLANPNASPNVTTTYIVTATNSSGCFSTDSISIVVNKLGSPEICMVSVDTASNKNLIVWEKPMSMPIDSFIIYKESNISNVYNRIATMPYDGLSEFVDMSSSPTIKSDSYKITIIDSCGKETDTSQLHKTIHLTINQGTGDSWNLIWNDYEGFTVASYNIYRGTTPFDLVLINSTTAGNTSYTDLLAPPGQVYYLVEVVNPNSCTPTRSTYYSSFSNIETNISVKVEHIGLSKMNFYPNPANDKLTIEIAQIAESILFLYNISGQELLKQKLNESKTVLDIGHLASGVYFIKLCDENTVEMRKIIKE
ncbi:MAG: YCF48-related protein [Bacteroidota bacterium]|nr:YCF48-related protein [Bacteroidota bacterium]